MGIEEQTEELKEIKSTFSRKKDTWMSKEELSWDLSIERLGKNDLHSYKKINLYYHIASTEDKDRPLSISFGVGILRYSPDDEREASVHINASSHKGNERVDLVSTTLVNYNEGTYRDATFYRGQEYARYLVKHMPEIVKIEGTNLDNISESDLGRVLTLDRKFHFYPVQPRESAEVKRLFKLVGGLSSFLTQNINHGNVGPLTEENLMPRYEEILKQAMQSGLIPESVYRLQE